MLSLDDDDDYFTPTATTGKRLAMLFTPEEMRSGSPTGPHADPTTHFRFVAPKQPRPGRSNSSASTSSGSGQVSSRDGQDVLSEVILTVLPQGPEKTKMPKIQVKCQLVGNAVRRVFALVFIQAKGELWRVAVDSHLLLEMVERSTVRVAAHGKSLVLVGEREQIDTLVTQLAIYRAVASDGPSQQDLCIGKGHVLSEGDVAKVSCTTYTITSTAVRGEKVEDLKGAKITVTPAASGGWESRLVGASVDTHRLIFLPKQKEGKWLPPTTYHDVTVLKVRSKGGKDKASAGAEGTGVAAATAVAVAVNNSSPGIIQQPQQTPTSHNTPVTAAPQTFANQNGDLAESQERDTQDDEMARKAALVSRMAQVGTALFPLMPGAKLVPQPSEPTAESKEAPTEEPSIPTSTSPTPASNPATPAPDSTPVLSSITPVNSTVPPSITTTPSHSNTLASTTSTHIPAPTLPPSHPQTPSLAQDSTLALSVCQLSTSVARISDKVDLLLAKMDKVEAGGPRGSASSTTSDPEALMALASGLVAHNERLRADVEAVEKKLSESQASCTSLLAMNAELLEEKRQMVKREAELQEEAELKREAEAQRTAELQREIELIREANLRREEEDKKEDRHKKEDPVKQDQEQEILRENEDIHGLSPEQVRLLFKSTLSGLFRHLSTAFSQEEEEQYTRPQILHTVRSGLEVAYSTLMEKLEEMTGDDGEEDEKTQQEEEEEKTEEEENQKSHPEVRSGKNNTGQE